MPSASGISSNKRAARASTAALTLSGKGRSPSTNWANGPCQTPASRSSTPVSKRVFNDLDQEERVAFGLAKQARRERTGSRQPGHLRGPGGYRLQGETLQFQGLGVPFFLLLTVEGGERVFASHFFRAERANDQAENRIYKAVPPAHINEVKLSSPRSCSPSS